MKGQVIVTNVYGNDLDKGDKVTYKITVKKGAQELSYFITGEVMEHIEK